MPQCRIITQLISGKWKNACEKYKYGNEWIGNTHKNQVIFMIYHIYK